MRRQRIAIWFIAGTMLIIGLGLGQPASGGTTKGCTVTTTIPPGAYSAIESCTFKFTGHPLGMTMIHSGGAWNIAWVTQSSPTGAYSGAVMSRAPYYYTFNCSISCPTVGIGSLDTDRNNYSTSVYDHNNQNPVPLNSTLHCAVYAQGSPGQTIEATCTPSYNLTT